MTCGARRATHNQKSRTAFLVRMTVLTDWAGLSWAGLGWVVWTEWIDCAGLGSAGLGWMDWVGLDWPGLALRTLAEVDYQ